MYVIQYEFLWKLTGNKLKLRNNGIYALEKNSFDSLQKLSWA